MAAEEAIAMPRSSGRISSTVVASVAATVLSAVIASPVAAAGPSPGAVVVGGGDDPSIVVEPSAADRALDRWKLRIGAELRAAYEYASRRASPRSVGTAQPDFIAPCGSDCPPDTFVLDSWARQQITWYYCGPAAAQVIINQSRGVVASASDGQSTKTNYRSQSAIGSSMGTNDSTGSSSWMVRSGLNEFADLDASGSDVPFTVVDIASGSDFHWAMVTATYYLRRGAAVPVQMTFSSQHLASWTTSWWNRNQGAIVRHWISVRGYSGMWDGSYAPSLAYTDSAGGYGGQTGNFTSSTRLVFNLNQANSGRIVY